MTSSDVRDILDLPSRSDVSHIAQQVLARPKAAPTAKKPDGISRELYALIGGNAASILQTQAPSGLPKYRQRPGNSQKINWEFRTFDPRARSEAERTLRHWVRRRNGELQSTEAYFAAFNSVSPSIMEYSQLEYDQHLTDGDWSQQETAYLFDLLREYDLRFIVAADRYSYVDSRSGLPGKARSVEELKDRYYTICRRLVRTRTASDPQTQHTLLQAYAFDKARESRRKQYVSELFHLTAAEIAEEEALYVEIKRIEQDERRYRADRDTLLRSVMGLDSGLVNLDQKNSEGVLGVDRVSYKKRKRNEEGDAVIHPQILRESQQPGKAKPSEASDVSRCIHRTSVGDGGHTVGRHPVHVPAYLRSTKLSLPKVNAAIRITELLAELGINVNRLVMPTKDNLDVFDRLLAAAASLIDMKRQVDRVEHELRTLRAQSHGFIPPLSRSARSASITSTATSGTKH